MCCSPELLRRALYQINVIVPNMGTGDKAIQATVNAVRTQAGSVVTVQ